MSALIVADIRKNGTEILIHFDGWKNTYDYWTTGDDPALHPVGYVAHLNHSGKNTRQKLSPYGSKYCL